MKHCVIVYAIAAVVMTSAWGKSPEVKPLPKAVHSAIGDSVSSADGRIALKLVAKRQAYDRDAGMLDVDISSPKSLTFSCDGSKFYVNSLEGCKTVVYDAVTFRKLKVIKHRFTSGQGPLWTEPSGYYRFTHYADGAQRAFSGKPVEAVITHNGRYLVVPYYRRTFDINAQDPSALAVIDTQTDSIVSLMETGPLPKMVRVSNDGSTLAVTHWGDNTVGLVDISNTDPGQWRHRKPVTVGKKLTLDYPLDSVVNRDRGSGYLLRGTLFLPGDSVMLVSAMAGKMAVVDVVEGKHIGWIAELPSVRHITASNGHVYFSRNVTGDVLEVSSERLSNAIASQRKAGDTVEFHIGGLRRCVVGSGARTIELSPSGRFLFAACSFASELCIVDAATMQVIARTRVDSFPVGLDVSADGSLVILTSQGRSGVGGNAVDIFRVTYQQPEPMPESLVNDEPAETEEIVYEEIEACEDVIDDIEKIDWRYILVTVIVVIVFIIGVISRKR